MVHQETRQSDSPLSSAAVPELRVEQFASRSEKAVARMLERFVPGWIPCSRTCQISIGPRAIDFFVPLNGGVYIEWHPIVLSRAFISALAHDRIINVSRRLKPHQKQELLSAVKLELASQYWMRRRYLLDANGQQDKLLIVAHTAEDLYDRFFKQLHVVSRSEFLKLFKAEMKNP